MHETAVLEHLVRSFLDFRGLPDISPYGNGNINDTYRVEMEQDDERRRYILQRLNHRVFTRPELVMKNTRRVTEFLASQPYPYRVAGPLPARDGKYLQTDAAGNYWRMFPFFDNTFAPEGLIGAEIAYEAAKTYGAFTRALRRFPAAELAETIPGFHDTDRRWAAFLQILENDTARRAASVQAEVKALYAAKPLFDRISGMKKSGVLPLRVTHNDTKAGNVLFDLETKKAVAVIDLDTVMPGTILSDFGDMVRTFTPTGYEDALPERLGFRTDILEALQNGFLEETADFITPAEKECLRLGACWMIMEQALRFLSDYLAGDVYYKIQYPEHNLVRARNQIALFALLRDRM